MYADFKTFVLKLSNSHDKYFIIDIYIHTKGVVLLNGYRDEVQSCEIWGRETTLNAA